MPVTDPSEGKYGVRVCAELVRLIDGSISLESREREGTEFQIKFPVTVDPSFYNQEVKNITKNDLTSVIEKVSGNHILIAEDVGEEPNVIAELVRSLNCSFSMVHDGYKLCKKYKRQYSKISACIVGEKLPQMDAIEAIKSIRKFEKEWKISTTPIFLINAVPQSITKADAKRLGANECLTKPI